MTVPATVQKDERKVPAGRDALEREFLASPFGLMRRFTREMERMFGDFGLAPRIFEDTAIDAVWAPDIEVFERDGKMIVRADLPGLTKDDVKVTVVDDLLTIEGERKREVETKRADLYRSERVYGAFFRRLPLPEGARTDQIQAAFKDGVLEVSMPVVEPKKQVKNVEVKVV